MGKMLSTEAMYPVILGSATAIKAARALANETDVRSASKYISEWMEAAGLTARELFKQAGIARSMGYKILSGQRVAGRDTLLCLAIVLRADLRSTQRLLAVCGHGALYPRNRRDLVIIHGLTHAATLESVQESLSELGETPLWKEP